MNKIKNLPTLIFLHIPKTAGRTFYNILVRQFLPFEILRLEYLFSKNCPRSSQSPYGFFNSFLQEYELNYLNNLPDDKKINLKCVTQGHLAFGLHTYFPQKASYVAFLRNPVDRVISQYCYLRRRPNNPLYYSVKNKTLKDYVEGERNPGQFSNVQTRFLCGQEGILKQGELSESDLELAQKRLKENFAFVGITEKFDESLICLKKFFGWKNIFYYKSNVSKKRPLVEEISRDTLRIIQEKNKLDVQLYKFARRMLERSINNYGLSFEADLRVLRKKLPVLGKLLYLRRIITASPRMYKDKLLIKLGEVKAKYDIFKSN